MATFFMITELIHNAHDQPKKNYPCGLNKYIKT